MRHQDIGHVAVVNQALLILAFVEQSVPFVCFSYFTGASGVDTVNQPCSKTPYGMKFQIPGVHQLMFCVFGCCVTVYSHCSSVLVDENLDQNLDSTEIKGNFASLEPRFLLKLEWTRNRL